MKLKLAHHDKPSARKVAEPELLSARPRSTFYMDESSAEMIQELKDEGDKYGIKYSISFVLREGAKLFVKQELIRLEQMASGEAHAKKRKVS